MPITEYKIVVGTTVEELTEGVVGAGCVPVGDLDPSTADYAMQAAGVGTVDLGTVSEYQVVLGETPLLLQNAVNEKIKEGLQPVGGVFHWQRGFLQAVGKIDASGSGGGGSAGDLPEGEAFQVLGFDAAKELKAMKSGMAQWLGEDRQIGGNAFNFVPVVYLTGKGQRVSEGVPNLLGLSNSPISSSIAIRDAGGVLSGNIASRDTELPNWKQVKDLVEAGGGGLTGTEYQVVSFNKETGVMESVTFNMNKWTGTDLPRYDAAMTFIPTTSFAAGGLSSTQGCSSVDVLPMRFAIAQRDQNGSLGVERANQPYHATNLQQVEEMIAANRKAIEEGIIDIINGAIGQ